jgi:hypothetical protein
VTSPQIDRFFRRRQEVDQECGETSRLQLTRHKLIARAVAAATAAMGEENDTAGLRRCNEIPTERDVADGD